MTFFFFISGEEKHLAMAMNVLCTSVCLIAIGASCNDSVTC